MTLPPDRNDPPRVVPSSEDDVYAVSEPAAPPKPLPAPAQSVNTVALAPADPIPEPTGLPFLAGVFTFPFYPQTLAPWILMSIGLSISLVGIVFCIWLVDNGMTIAARCMVLSFLWIGGFALSYASTCCLSVIEETSQGYDKITDWLPGDWREWFWSLPTTLGLLAAALALGGLFSKLTGSESWLPMLVVAFVIYPIFLLSAIEGGSPLSVLAGPILRSLVSVWWAWLIFYLETAVLIVAWALPAIAAFPYQPFVTAAVAGPLVAVTMLIYARLLGRVVWCFGQYGQGETED